MNLSWSTGIILLIVAVAESTIQYEELENNEIYTFQNQADGSYLTAVSLPTPYAPIISDLWMDAPTQKWRVKSAVTSRSYQLFPIYANEQQVMYYDNSQGIVYQDTPGMSLSSKQFWQLQYVGQGYFLIHSYKDDRCLENMGPGQPAVVVECNFLPGQQWAVNII